MASDVDASKKLRVKIPKGKKHRKVVGDIELMESISSIYAQHFKNVQQIDFPSVIDKLKDNQKFYDQFDTTQTTTDHHSHHDSNDVNNDDDDDEDDDDNNEMENINDHGDDDILKDVEDEVNNDLQREQENKSYITIGLIGHPNVGKSSLINGIKGAKVVSTSRTPGHTKHFQV